MSAKKTVKPMVKFTISLVNASAKTIARIPCQCADTNFDIDKHVRNTLHTVVWTYCIGDKVLIEADV